jgi:hypothetical protein
MDAELCIVCRSPGKYLALGAPPKNFVGARQGEYVGYWLCKDCLQLSTEDWERALERECAYQTN